MRKTLTMLAVASLAGALPMQVAPAYAQAAPAKPAAHYSATSTLIGKLLDDPAAAEVLKRLIPTVYANDMFQQSGRTITLKDAQQYEPDALSDANLAKIQAEFDKLPAKE
jgi:hypothetical protein